MKNWCNSRFLAYYPKCNRAKFPIFGFLSQRITKRCTKNIHAQNNQKSYTEYHTTYNMIFWIEKCAVGNVLFCLCVLTLCSLYFCLPAFMLVFNRLLGHTESSEYDTKYWDYDHFCYILNAISNQEEPITALHLMTDRGWWSQKKELCFITGRYNLNMQHMTTYSVYDYWIYSICKFFCTNFHIFPQKCINQKFYAQKNQHSCIAHMVKYIMLSY